MDVDFAYPPRPARRARVIVVNGSGAGDSQWCTLPEALGMIAMGAVP
jgi:hypothetical protein